jgi:hypothetical protein
MSFILKKEGLHTYWKSFIKDNCNITGSATVYNNYNPPLVCIFKNDKDSFTVPLALWKDVCSDFPNNSETYQRISTTKNFTGELQENDDRDQKTVMKEAISKLETDHTLLLALRTGFGKTASMFYLICHFKLKTVILSFSNKLHTQYVEQGNKWCPSLKIQIVKGEDLDPSYDVYIMGIIKATHIPKEKFKDIGMVFVDEAQMTLTDTFSDALLQFQPKYLIGLSATPDRKDGMHSVLYPFFGKKESFIVRHQVKEFTVIKYNTNFKPIIKQNKTGMLDWSTVIRTISSNEKRQKLIIDLCLEYPKDKILILCKRVCTILGCENYKKCKCPWRDTFPSDNIKSIGLVPLLKKEGESYDYCCDSKKNADESKRIMIGTLGKLGVGYDSDRTLLILESDIVDVRQYEGRIRCDKNIVIDIVDKFGTLSNHFEKERLPWYLKRGAKIVERNSWEKNSTNSAQNKEEPKHIKLVKNKNDILS